MSSVKILTMDNGMNLTQAAKILQGFSAFQTNNPTLATGTVAVDKRQHPDFFLPCSIQFPLQPGKGLLHCGKPLFKVHCLLIEFCLAFKLLQTLFLITFTVGTTCTTCINAVAANLTENHFRTPDYGLSAAACASALTFSGILNVFFTPFLPQQPASSDEDAAISSVNAPAPRLQGQYENPPYPLALYALIF